MSFFAPPTPYPVEQYSGSDGTTDTFLRLADAPHDLGRGAASTDYLATGELTHGEFGLYRWNMSAEPSGPGPHFHRSISESFFILSGTIRLFHGDHWVDGRPGDFLYVPQGARHGFRNESGEPASMLLLFTPGAPREKYFEGLASLAQAEQRPSEDEMNEFYRRHDNFWL